VLPDPPSEPLSLAPELPLEPELPPEPDPLEPVLPDPLPELLVEPEPVLELPFEPPLLDPDPPLVLPELPPEPAPELSMPPVEPPLEESGDEQALTLAAAPTAIATRTREWAGVMRSILVVERRRVGVTIAHRRTQGAETAFGPIPGAVASERGYRQRNRLPSVPFASGGTRAPEARAP
jgi:hypothetical protein